MAVDAYFKIASSFLQRLEILFIGLKMNAVTKIFILFTLFSTAQSGPLAYAICQTGCNAVWVACVAAAGGTAGVSTGGAAVPAAILACNAAQGVCMAACVAAGLSPTV